MRINRNRAKFTAVIAAVIIGTGTGGRIYAAETEPYSFEAAGAEIMEGTGETEAPDIVQKSGEQGQTAFSPEAEIPVTEAPGPDIETVQKSPDIPSSPNQPEVDFSSGDQEETPDAKGEETKQETSDAEKENPKITDRPLKPSEEPEKPQPEEPGAQTGALYISREKLEKGIRANSDFAVTILLNNTWKEGRIKNGKIYLELPDGLYLHPSYKRETLEFPDIRAGAAGRLRVKLRAGELKEDGRTLRVKVRASFCHEPDKAETEQQEVLLLPVNNAEGKGVFVDNTASYPAGGDAYAGGAGDSGEEKKKADPMVPRVIVSQFDYDKDAAAGKNFKVSIILCNTSEKLNAENMVVTMEAGENAALQGTSNMVYVKNLKPQETFRTELELKTPEDGKTDSADVTLNLKYEYLKNQERTEVESTQKISVPVQIPDRFSAGEIQTGDETVEGEEFTVSLPYVNKGKIAVSNVEAVIRTGMKAGETYKYLGNLEAGSSGTLDFFVTPEKKGDQKVAIAITYENSAGQEKTIEKEKVFQIKEAEPDPGEALTGEEPLWDMEEQAGTGRGDKLKPGLFAAAGGMGALASASGIKRFKRRKKTIEDEEF